MNRAQLGLWSAIAGVFLLAILGIRSASNWLTQSTPDDPANQTITATGNDGSQATGERLANNGGQDTSRTGTRTEDSIANDPDASRINAQTGQPSDQQTDGTQTGTLTFSPLEEAGTYIQRQKRVERDSFVAATQVDAQPVASSDSAATQAQSDSRVEQPAPDTVSDTQSSQPSSAAPSSPAVPALW